MATKIYPTCEELSTVDCHVPCTEEGCTKVFSSRSNLNFHLTKTHHQRWVTDATLKEFYCPNIDCIFNSGKYFKSHKLLKQHYLKVHCEKRFVCEICTKGFPTLSSRDMHTKYCGTKFQCCECNVAYASYESLLTHGRRKKHKVLEKVAYNPSVVKSLQKINLTNYPVQKVIFIVPKATTSLPLVIPTSFNPTLEKGIQTELRILSPKLKTKQTQVVNKRTSQESQTLSLQKSQSSAETQTIGDYSAKKLKLADCNPNKKNSYDSIEHKSIETQTMLLPLNSQSCNTSFDLSDEDFIVANPTVHKSNSGTQTSVESLYSISTATHDSIHTDTSDLNFEFINSSSQTCFNEDMSAFSSSNYFNCNMETQTDFLFDNVLLNYEAGTESPFDDDLENYCHKPYDDILNTIHTQTFSNDVARSVESQTVMSHTQIRNTVYKDMANNETQTDTNFQKLLEEINA